MLTTSMIVVTKGSSKLGEYPDTDDGKAAAHAKHVEALQAAADAAGTAGTPVRIETKRVEVIETVYARSLVGASI